MTDRPPGSPSSFHGQTLEIPGGGSSLPRDGPREDGGKTVFEEDRDHFTWLDGLETTRVLRAFRLSEGRAGGKAYGASLKARGRDPETAMKSLKDSLVLVFKD